MNDLANSVYKKVFESYASRLDKELYAAWRAGYDYLHTAQTINDDFEAKFYFYPSNYHQPPFDIVNAETYDLREESLSDSAWKRLQDHKP